MAVGEGVFDLRTLDEGMCLERSLFDDNFFPEREENWERCRTRVSFILAILSEKGGGRGRDGFSVDMKNTMTVETWF